MSGRAEPRSPRGLLRTLGALLMAGVLLTAAAAAWVFYPVHVEPLSLPDGKRFAFSIVDDSDDARLEGVAPVYRFLRDEGLRTTKTVWVRPPGDGASPERGHTLRDAPYLDFILDLQASGFEIASHGAREISTEREEILGAMAEFRQKLGHYPKIHVNHHLNQDNVYWGADRHVIGAYRWLNRLILGQDAFSGHEPKSEYFWGDFVRDHVDYVVNFSFYDLNLLNVNPRFPYHLREKPYVRYWFHSSDGGDLERFNELLSPERLDALEAEAGVSIVYAHLGRDFYRDGQLDPTFVTRIQDLASRDGWFVPAGELLDFLRDQRGQIDLSLREKIRIESLWLLTKLRLGRT